MSRAGFWEGAIMSLYATVTNITSLGAAAAATATAAGCEGEAAVFEDRGPVAAAAASAAADPESIRPNDYHMFVSACVIVILTLSFPAIMAIVPMVHLGLRQWVRYSSRPQRIVHPAIDILVSVAAGLILDATVRTRTRETMKRWAKLRVRRVVMMLHGVTTFLVKTTTALEDDDDDDLGTEALWDEADEDEYDEYEYDDNPHRDANSYDHDGDGGDDDDDETLVYDEDEYDDDDDDEAHDPRVQRVVDKHQMSYIGSTSNAHLGPQEPSGVTNHHDEEEDNEHEPPPGGANEEGGGNDRANGSQGGKDDGDQQA